MSVRELEKQFAASNLNSQTDGRAVRAQVNAAPRSSERAQVNNAAASSASIKASAAIAEAEAADAAQKVAESAVKAALARQKVNPTAAADAEVKAARQVWRSTLQDFERLTQVATARLAATASNLSIADAEEEAAAANAEAAASSADETRPSTLEATSFTTVGHPLQSWPWDLLQVFNTVTESLRITSARGFCQNPKASPHELLECVRDVVLQELPLSATQKAARGNIKIELETETMHRWILDIGLIDESGQSQRIVRFDLHRSHADTSESEAVNHAAGTGEAANHAAESTEAGEDESDDEAEIDLKPMILIIDAPKEGSDIALRPIACADSAFIAFMILNPSGFIELPSGALMHIVGRMGLTLELDQQTPGTTREDVEKHVHAVLNHYDSRPKPDKPVAFRVIPLAGSDRRWEVQFTFYVEHEPRTIALIAFPNLVLGAMAHLARETKSWVAHHSQQQRANSDQITAIQEEVQQQRVLFKNVVVTMAYALVMIRLDHPKRSAAEVKKHLTFCLDFIAGPQPKESLELGDTRINVSPVNEGSVDGRWRVELVFEEPHRSRLMRVSFGLLEGATKDRFTIAVKWMPTEMPWLQGLPEKIECVKPSQRWPKVWNAVADELQAKGAAAASSSSRSAASTEAYDAASEAASTVNENQPPAASSTAASTAAAGGLPKPSQREQRSHRSFSSGQSGSGVRV